MLETEKDRRRRSRSEIFSVLQGRGINLTRGQCCCPFHQDDNPSAGVFEGKDGIFRFKCLGCGWKGDVFDLMAKLDGKPVAEVLKAGGDGGGQARPAWHVDGEQRRSSPAEYPSPEAVQHSLHFVVDRTDYTNPETGRIDLVTFRIEPPGKKKEFCQCHQNAAGKWVKRKPEGQQPLLNRYRLRNASVAIVVEGEKCVKALTKILPAEVAATTCPGGSAAGIAEGADWSLLNGKEAVYLFPDADDAKPDGSRGGVDHAERIVKILAALPEPPALWWIDPYKLGLSGGGDVADWLAAIEDQSPANLLRQFDEKAMTSARSLAASAPLRQRLDDAKAGRWCPAALPWFHLNRLTQALLPGTQTVLCGQAGASKSFCALQLLLYLHGNGHRVAYYALEGDDRFHQQRMLAQLAGNSNLLNAEWIRGNPGMADDAFAACKKTIDSFAPRVTVLDEAIPTFNTVLDWIETRFRSGTRVAVIDPVTFINTDQRSWEDDKKFVFAAGKLAQRYAASLVYVSHPKKGAKGSSALLDDMAGGAAFSRNTDCVVWLRSDNQRRDDVFTVDRGVVNIGFNRSAKVAKTRNGPGDGREVAFDFTPVTLTWRELGPVTDGGYGGLGSEREQAESYDVAGAGESTGLI